MEKMAKFREILTYKVQAGFLPACPRSSSRVLGRSCRVSGGVIVCERSWMEAITVRKTFRKCNKNSPVL
jgi:hypothetical protein